METTNARSIIPIGMLNESVQSHWKNSTFSTGDYNFFLEFEKIEDEPALKTFSRSAQRGLLAVVIISFFVGSYFKHIYHQNILHCGVTFKECPINLMLLIGSMIQEFKHIFLCINYTLALGFDVEMGEHLGESYCTFTLFVAVFGDGHLVAGSLMIAIYRVLYIKCDTWVKYKAGKVRLLVILLGFGLLITTFFTIIIVTEDSSHWVVFNICMGHSSEFWDIVNQYAVGK